MSIKLCFHMNTRIQVIVKKTVPVNKTDFNVKVSGIEAIYVETLLPHMVRSRIDIHFKRLSPKIMQMKGIFYFYLENKY